MQAAPVSQVAVGQSSAQLSRSPDIGFGFSDFLDIINPLHHIPIVGAVYREVTGDEIGPVAQLVGGGLYGAALLGGGWVSLASTAANVALEQATGNDLLGHAIDFVMGEDGEIGGKDGGAATAAEGEVQLPPAPAAVVVRSTPLTGNEGATLMDSAPAATGPDDPAALAAAAGQPVISPETLMVAQGAEAAPADEVAPEDAPSGPHLLAPGLIGFSLDDAEVQIGRGATRDRFATIH